MDLSKMTTEEVQAQLSLLAEWEREGLQVSSERGCSVPVERLPTPYSRVLRRTISIQRCNVQRKVEHTALPLCNDCDSLTQ